MSQDLRLDDWRAVTILGFGVDVPEISLIVLLLEATVLLLS